MGYSTRFDGELKFSKELTVPQLAKVKSFLGEDGRQHPEWGATDLTYFDLELNDDFTGIRWDGGEKTYDLVEKVNVIIREMQKDYPDFVLVGDLYAQGEDVKDRWILSATGNEAVRKEFVLAPDQCTCPNCGHTFKP